MIKINKKAQTYLVYSLLYIEFIIFTFLIICSCYGIFGLDGIAVIIFSLLLSIVIMILNHILLKKIVRQYVIFIFESFWIITLILFTLIPYYHVLF